MNRHTPVTFSDKFAKRVTWLLRWCADTFFAKRYGHRAIVLETVAAVPGMVSGVFMHFKSLRSMQMGYGPKLREMLAEAENERMHLMTFIQVAKPTSLERFIIIIAQFLFIIMYSIIYLLSQRTAHRIVGYFEEEAVFSYTEYLKELESGRIDDQPAPKIAIEYWNLPLHSTLKDVVRVVRDDEAGHRDVNHSFARILNEKLLKKKQSSNKKEDRTFGLK